MTLRTILALDLGSSTGWAVRLACGEMVSGRSSFAVHRGEGAGMRILRFGGWLNDVADAIRKTDCVYYELVARHVGTDAAHVYGGLMGQLQAWCEARKIPYAGVPVGTIKKHATGKGNACKAAMISAAERRGWTIAPGKGADDEADAIAILEWVIDQEGGGGNTKVIRA